MSTARSVLRVAVPVFYVTLLGQGCRPSSLPDWQPVSEGIPGQVGIAAVAVAPGHPQVLYLSAYEPGGLYRSADGGQTWVTASGGLEGTVVYGLAVAPDDAHLVFAAALGGGYRSSDGGESWQCMSDLPPASLYALGVHSDGQAVWAGGEATGLWHSANAGQTWDQASTAPDQYITVLSLAVSREGTAYAGTAGQGLWVYDKGTVRKVAGEQLASTHVTALAARDDALYVLGDGILYHSGDLGLTWHPVGPPDWQTSSWQTLSLGVEPGPRGAIYLGSQGSGVAVSDDGGMTWAQSGSGLWHADITCLAADPSTPGTLYAGTLHNGLHKTEDSGQSWRLVSGQLGAPLVSALAQHRSQPQPLFAGALDGIYRTGDGGKSWHLMSAASGQLAVQGLSIDPQNPKIVYAGTNAGVYQSSDGGQTWRWASEDLGRVTVFNVTVDAHNQRCIYAGSWGNNVLRSNDGGMTWAPIHHGLETLSAHAFAVDPHDPRRLYAGTVEAVYRSTDGGETWQKSAPSTRPITTFALAISPADDQTVYAGTTEGVYKSTDGGGTWRPQPLQHSDAQPRQSISVMALTLDPQQADALYAGTEHHGLYRSSDRGETWEQWGLPGISVYAILMDSASGLIWAGTEEGVYRRELAANETE